MSFFGEKVIFPSAPVPGINNDQSLNDFGGNWQVQQLCLRSFMLSQEITIRLSPIKFVLISRKAMSLPSFLGKPCLSHPPHNCLNPLINFFSLLF